MFQKSGGSDLFITGIGRTKFGIIRNKSLPELAYEAIYEAIYDSEISINEIDAVFVSNFIGGQTEKQLHLNSVISSLLPDCNMPIIRIETACASGGSSLYQALISLNKFNNVLVVGVEKMTGFPNKQIIQDIAMAGHRLDQQQGLIFPAAYALIAQQHMIKYGTLHEDLELISYKNHLNANLNPLAHFHYKHVDLETIANSPIVASPLNLFDCSPVSDGAAAVVLSNEKKSDRDVKIIASAMATDHISLTQRRDLTSFVATKIAARDAFAHAKLEPKNIDIFEVHDCFTISELIAMEDIGICKASEGKYLIREGRTHLDGDFPVNTDGGLKANGHPIGATGIAQIYEIVSQLRGEAGKRQIADAEVGLAQNIGGIGGTAVIHIMEKC